RLGPFERANGEETSPRSFSQTRSDKSQSANGADALISAFNLPGGNRASRATARSTSARRASERERANQSKCARRQAPNRLTRVSSRKLSPAGIEPTFKV